MDDHANEYIVKKQEASIEKITIIITSPVDTKYIKKHVLDYVKSGSGEKFVGAGIQFWIKGNEGMLDFEGNYYNCELR